jgi:carbamoyltransferase
MNILGISYSMHESAACLLQDGKLKFACAEERLSRRKQDGSFPVLAIQAALKHGGIRIEDVDHVAIGWPKPIHTYSHNLKLLLTGKWPNSWMRWERLLTGFAQSQRHRGGEVDFIRAFGKPQNPIHFVNHHLAHALSAYCLSEFDEAAVLVIDGRGSSEATTLWHAKGGQIQLLEQYEYPNSIGVFYAGITKQLGFQPLSDEWKVMGLAAYGESKIDLSKVIRCTEDSYLVNGRPFFGKKSDADLDRLEEIIGPRRNEEELNQYHFDLARSAQDACEEAMLAVLRRVTKLTGSRKLCLAGGVALNCKANGELLRSGLIDEIFVQPAAGDDGTCIGAAYAVYQALGLTLPRNPIGHTYLGNQYTNEEIERVLQIYKLPYHQEPDVTKTAAKLLAQNHLIGWFQGPEEFGPRALGGRSILADPRFVENRDRVNDAVKFRENWRPFAPSVLLEKAGTYFQDFKPSPYMILSFWVDQTHAHKIPAVVHVDGSCRVQSVEQATNSRYYNLIKEFEKLTHVPVVMNTSFNLKGDPVVSSPKDAVQTFYTSGLDNLVIGDFIVSKSL